MDDREGLNLSWKLPDVPVIRFFADVICLSIILLSTLDVFNFVIRSNLYTYLLHVCPSWERYPSSIHFIPLKRLYLAPFSSFKPRV